MLAENAQDRWNWPSLESPATHVNEMANSQDNPFSQLPSDLVQRSYFETSRHFAGVYLVICIFLFLYFTFSILDTLVSRRTEIGPFLEKYEMLDLEAWLYANQVVYLVEIIMYFCKRKYLAPRNMRKINSCDSLGQICLIPFGIYGLMLSSQPRVPKFT